MNGPTGKTRFPLSGSAGGSLTGYTLTLSHQESPSACQQRIGRILMVRSCNRILDLLGTNRNPAFFQPLNRSVQAPHYLIVDKDLMLQEIVAAAFAEVIEHVESDRVLLAWPNADFLFDFAQVVRGVGTIHKIVGTGRCLIR